MYIKNKIYKKPCILLFYVIKERLLPWKALLFWVLVLKLTEVDLVGLRPSLKNLRIL